MKRIKYWISIKIKGFKTFNRVNLRNRINQFRLKNSDFSIISQN